jgi:16S rRNA (cytosine1402-N4)-methyltransferase
VSAAAEHRPVLLKEALAALAVVDSGCYVDGTFGRGGHSGAILQRLGPEGCLLALDRDPEAVAVARSRFGADPRFRIVHASFGNLAAVVDRAGYVGRVNGLLLDLGVSSPQLDDAERGFSFMQDGPLDMRMDPTAGESAADWLNRAAEEQIAQVLFEYGEERFSRRIARAVVARRKQTPWCRTGELAELIAAAVPVRERHKHPATRCFQAIRIHVNRELEALQDCLEQALEVLAGGARIVVISFHSLEDRIVKQFFRRGAEGEKVPKGLPVRQDQLRPPRLRLVGRAARPDELETQGNVRARSAVIRVAEVLS